MTAAQDTTGLTGGPITRYGGKGQIAHRILPHFASARIYLEPYFGAGGMFFAVPPGTYEREAVNDLDASLVTFFRVLRDRTDALVAAFELTPYARDEFAACIAHAADDLEEARRVWVRSRQGFGGTSGSVGRWGRDTTSHGPWKAGHAEAKLAALRTYAARLRHVEIDNIDAIDFLGRWAGRDAFAYCDPPYVRATRRGDAYVHEMTDADHLRFAAACHAAVEHGARAFVRRDSVWEEVRLARIDAALSRSGDVTP
ncbi:MAG TPA: DNA adenine methylase [Gammaproteobacteria bacterium]|nr:DNA adenine methylase [Gammaproteobacteria bacterium]